MPSYVISGANRGIGFGLTERLSQDASNVIFAGARNPSDAKALNDLAAKSEGKLQVIQLDPTSQESVDAAVKFVEEKHGSLDVLVNNAGTAAGGFSGPTQFDFEDARSNFEVNFLGVARLTNAMLPLLRKGSTKHVFVISSAMGTPGWYKILGSAIGTAYGSTKSAATLLAVHYAIELKAEGFVVKPVHPGWVRTDMGTEAADISLEESVDGLMKVFAKTTIDQEIGLYNYDNTILPF